MNSRAWKWAGVVVLGVIGILAIIVGIIYLTEPIHSLPAFLGGKHAVGNHHYRGNHKRRGEALIVVAVVVLGLTAYFVYRLVHSEPGRDAPAVDSARPAASDSASLLSQGQSSEAPSSEPPPSPSSSSEAPPQTATEPQ